MKSFILVALFSLSTFSVLAAANIRNQPLFLINQVWTLEADFPLSAAWTLGPMVRYISDKQGGYDVKAYALGIRGNYSFSGQVFTDSWYFSPFISYLNVEVRDESTIFKDLKGSGSGLFAATVFGHQWFWKNFNIMLGVGPLYYALDKIKLESSDGTVDEDYRGYFGLGLTLDFSLGWKF